MRDDQIEALMMEAARAGDYRQVAMCRIALDGPGDEGVMLSDEDRARLRATSRAAAREACARVLHDAASFRWSVGDRVEGGEPGTEDHDAGNVLAVEGPMVFVGWDGGDRTWTPGAELRGEVRQ